jgi:hypothetical protein
MYRIPDARRAQLCESLTTWLSSEEFTELAVARKTGSSESLQGSMDADELGHIGDPSEILDEVVERWGASGGTFILRAIFGRDSGNGNKPKQMATRKMQLVRARAEQRTPSRGAESGVESLSTSLSGALDTLQRQVVSQGEQQAGLMQGLLQRTDDQNLTRVQEITGYQTQIMDLQVQLSEEKMLRIIAEQDPGVSQEVVVMGMQILAPPVAQVLSALATKLSSSVAGAVTEGAAAATKAGTEGA